VGVDFGGGGAGVYQVAEFFAGFEEGDAFCGDVDFGAGLGVAADAGFALAGAEAAEAADLDLVVGFESADDGFKHCVDDDLAVFAGEITEGGHLLNQVCFCHVGLPSCLQYCECFVAFRMCAGLARRRAPLCSQL